MALDRACAPYEQPTETTHCPNLDTRGREDQKTAEGDMEKNCEVERQKMGFTTWIAELLQLQETEQVGGHMSMALFSQRRARK